MTCAVVAIIPCDHFSTSEISRGLDDGLTVLNVLWEVCWGVDSAGAEVEKRRVARILIDQRFSRPVNFQNNVRQFWLRNSSSASFSDSKLYNWRWVRLLQSGSQVIWRMVCPYVCLGLRKEKGTIGFVHMSVRARIRRSYCNNTNNWSLNRGS